QVRGKLASDVQDAGARARRAGHLDLRAVSLWHVRPVAQFRDFRRRRLLHGDGNRNLPPAPKAARSPPSGEGARLPDPAGALCPVDWLDRSRPARAGLDAHLRIFRADSGSARSARVLRLEAPSPQIDFGLSSGCMDGRKTPAKPPKTPSCPDCGAK